MVAATRTRIRTDYVQEASVDLFWTHDGGTYIRHHVHPTFSYWDEITDQYRDTGRSRNKLVYSVHPCTHMKIRTSDCILRNFNSDHGSQVIMLNNTRAELRPEKARSCAPAIPDAVRADLNLEAFNSFTTQFPEKISFTEFLNGLWKFKELLPKISGDVLRDLANVHLGQKFGWDNLISDLKALSKLVQDVQDRIDWLKDTFGKPTRLGYYAKDVWTPNLGLYVQDMSAYSRWWTRLVPTSYRADYRAGAWLLQFVDHLDDWFGQLRGFVGTLGLGNPIKAIWVNTPLSFMVDWFFNVSAHLDKLTNLQGAEQWDLYGVTNTVRYYVDVRVEQFSLFWFDPPIPEDQTTPVGTMTIRIYDRQVGLPVKPGQLDWNNLSPQQLVLMLAMLGSRRT